MSILIWVEHDNASVKDATNKTVTAALHLSGDVDVLVAGIGASGAASGAGAIAGVRKVLHAEGDAFGQNIAEAVEGLIVPLMAGYDAVVAAASSSQNSIRR